MKKSVIFIVTLAMLTLMPVIASAYDWRDDDRDNDGPRHRYHRYDDDRGRPHYRPYYRPYNRYYHDDRSWHRNYGRYDDDERRWSFRWRQRYEDMRWRYHLERMYGYEWEHRFPGAYPYRWHDDGGFWHRGHRVTDAVFFYNSDNELISIGYMYNGVFIHFREDRECYENRDSFFLAWWRH